MVLPIGHDGRAVANFILDHCDSAGIPVTHLALQKLVYFCHVWSLVDLGKPLVRHKFEAWEHGPVLPYLYRQFKVCDRLPITFRATRISPTTGHQEIVEYVFDGKTESHLMRILKFYTRLGPSDLRNLSHIRGGPWDLVWNHEETVKPGMQIDDAEIMRFYSSAPHPYSIQ